MWKYTARNIHTVVQDETSSQLSNHVQNSSPDSLMSGFSVRSEELLCIHTTPYLTDEELYKQV